MLGLEYFGFRALWSPVLLLFIIAVAVAYLYVTGPLRHRFQEAEPVKAKVKFRFLLGLFLFYLAQGGPIDLLGHMMFSAHMLSMSIAYLIVPPLILLGLPAWLVRPVFQYRIVKKASYLVLNPLITVLLFNVLFSFYHIPAIHDVVMTNYTLHTVYYMLLLISAFMMWWQIACPVPELNRLSELQRMAYVFVNGVLLTPACALIVFAGAPLYATYSDPNIWATAMGYCVPANSNVILSDFGGPEFFSILPPLDDQQLGGVIMKLVQEIMYGGILAYIFYQWYRRENVDNDDDMNPKDSSLEFTTNPDLNRA
jgi:putative membrane protein